MTPSIDPKQLKLSGAKVTFKPHSISPQVQVLRLEIDGFGTRAQKVTALEFPFSLAHPAHALTHVMIDWLHYHPDLLVEYLRQVPVDYFHLSFAHWPDEAGVLYEESKHYQNLVPELKALGLKIQVLNMEPILGRDTAKAYCHLSVGTPTSFEARYGNVEPFLTFLNSVIDSLQLIGKHRRRTTLSDSLEVFLRSNFHLRFDDLLIALEMSSLSSADYYFIRKLINGVSFDALACDYVF